LALVLLFLGLMILMVIGVPISFVLGVTSVATIKSQSPLPLVLVIQRMFVGLNSFTLLAVPFFMLAANLMNNAGISNKLIRFSQALVGNVRASLAHVNVIVSMIFAGISGSSQADTAGIGSVLIPAMEAEGYSKETSVAVTAASSTIGVVIPPSIPMVVYGSTMGVSIAGLFLGGVIPGILVGLGQMLVIALLKDYNIRQDGKPFSLKELFASFLDAFWALGTPILIIGGIISGVFTATEAAVVASVYSLFVGLVIYRTLKPSDLPKIFMETAVFSSVSLFCVATASVFGWLLAYYHVPTAVSDFLARFAHSPFLIMAIINVVFLIVGTFMDAIPAIMILAPVIGPIAHAAGIHPIHLGVVIVMNLAIGLITPPYGLCLLLACTIARIPVKQALPALLPFIIIMLGTLLIATYLPDVVMFVPKLLIPQFL